MPARIGWWKRGGDSGRRPAGQTHAPTLGGRLCGTVSNLTLLQSHWQCLPEARTTGRFREIIRQTVPRGSPVQNNAYEFFTPWFPLPQLLKWQELCPLYRWEPREVGTRPCHHGTQGQTWIHVQRFLHQCVDGMDIYGLGNLRGRQPEMKHVSALSKTLEKSEGKSLKSHLRILEGFPRGSVRKYPLANARGTGDAGSIPGLGRSPGEGNGSPFQYSCLENSMDRGAWWATVHGLAKSQT